ncbi:MAG: hypothetical protein ABIR18_00620, partial [Chitinophagaceae bacterium]
MILQQKYRVGCKPVRRATGQTEKVRDIINKFNVYGLKFKVLLLEISNLLVIATIRTLNFKHKTLNLFIPFFMAVLSQSFFTLVRRNFMTLS